MKTLLIHIWLVLSLSLAVAGCGGRGGTETGTSEPIDPQTLSARIETVASALVLSMSDAGQANASAEKAISYQTAEEWAKYLEAPNTTYLTGIFGPAGTPNPPESRIRVVVAEYAAMLNSVFTADPNLTCAEASPLDEGDTIQIPFYGTVSNGSEGDRYFRCLREWSGQKALYGQDNAGVSRIVYMRDATDAVEAGRDPDLGSANRQRFVVQSSYAEVAGDGVTNAFLDLQYAKTLLYDGTDTTFGTADDHIYQVRSRITGSVDLDAAGAATTVRNGDFTVISVSQGKGDDDQWLTTHTDAIGRGNAMAGGHLLFNIDVHSNDPAVVAGIYCITAESDGTPAYADPSNCSAYEGAVPWSGEAFPFAPSPAIDEAFESKAFYQANDTDLISTAGSNFTIPEYRTTSSSGS